jgi:D-sedoheptulose 7-phosphate isomerase
VNWINETTKRNPSLIVCEEAMESAVDAIVSCYRSGGTVLLCGNGGSNSDADHIVAELMKSFMIQRELPDAFSEQINLLSGDEALSHSLQVPIRALNISTPSAALSSAYANDVNAEFTYAQEALAFADENGVFWGISTSGNAKNVHYAALVSKAKGARLIGLTGMHGGLMKDYYDIIIKVPENETHLIQDLHRPVYHAICLEVERRLFGLPRA